MSPLVTRPSLPVPETRGVESAFFGDAPRRWRGADSRMGGRRELAAGAGAAVGLGASGAGAV